MSLRSRLLLNMTFLMLFVVTITILATNFIVRQSLVEQAQVDGEVIAQLFSRLVQGDSHGQVLDGEAEKAQLSILNGDKFLWERLASRERHSHHGWKAVPTWFL